MSSHPIMTVGLPVYNGERFLGEALEAILGQTFGDFHLVVSDNASTDRTREICLDYAAKDARIRYARMERNLGAAANYNSVFRATRSRYFKWATHDDAYAPTFLERCLEVLEAEPDAVLCYAPAIFIDEEGAEIGRENEEPDYTDSSPHRRLRAWLFEKREGWCHPIMGVIRSGVLSKTHLIGPYASSDRVLIAELALRGKMRRLPEYLYYRRDHPQRSISANRGVEQIMTWYDTSARPGKVYLPRWRWGGEFSRAVARVPMSPLEKTACAGIMAKWYFRRRSGLARELVGWVKRSGGRDRQAA